MPLTKIPQNMLVTDVTQLGFGPDTPSLTNIDFNSLTTSGVYMVMNTGTTNGPYADGSSGGLTHVMRSQGGTNTYIRQVWYSVSNPEIWTRQHNGVQWTTWRRMHNYTASLSASGYQELPSGLILQWGADNSSAANPLTITFPLPFPNACLNVQGTAFSSTPVIVTALNQTATTVEFRRFTDAGAASTSIIHWTAIGW